MIEKGKVSYIGNLHFDEHWENIRLRDKAARDLPLLAARYQVLKTAPVAYAIAPGTDVVKIGGDYDRSVWKAIFVPYIPPQK